MKKITYTQLRAGLSGFLEDIRNGESIIVTQKGKTDIIIQNGGNNANSVHKQLKNDEIKNSGTFKKALMLTKKNYAHIIKALEDK
ncbi:hypothetical protein QE177_14670 (plasmid) [Arsenophonus sp. aPb]|uniref:type II toxin-antitoxin system Phd/YefM family antitoxin n=1 Tax=Arsenophonus sp. aPb TaxID=3041619 RepID=UPI00246946D7|nr:hypothetical protein [Arsenophonus sp. aPb]WGL99764.1 hypothetical protein QE177_14670 [Arsenophonus sp. aPb]